MTDVRVINGKNWKTLLILSIIIPVSLLTTFKLTGTIQSPEVKETTELPTVTWNMTRPTSRLFVINKSVESFYKDETISLNFSLFVWDYVADDSWFGEFVEFRPKVMANVPNGFINSLNIMFSPIDNNAFLDIIKDKVGFFTEEHNLEIQSWKDSGETNQPYVKATAIGQPLDCYLLFTSHWIFLDRNEQDHLLTVTLSITYFNGQAYKKIVAPIEIYFLRG